ncbi:transcriptional regulatory [Fusarium heterosporum]|uniref:Transcriptional regulatory n=1 Tax=Fusarium heterosporum TaxID=42747 RepID=A0A8H5T874_FUSHE|nr:transcriptional regulatory [Fusarium heterosporum]
MALKVSIDHRSTSPTSLLAPLPSITSYSIPFRVPGSQRDRHMLHYFCVQGSNDISGFLNCDFWSQTVLQESHQDPTVRQALVAMSSIHLHYSTPGTSENSVVSTEILAQYGKALRSMKMRLSKPSQDTVKVALICCIMFYCCEGALGSRDAALQHLRNGLNLLIATKNDPREKILWDIQTISSVFERLDMQASFFEDDRTPVLTLPELRPGETKPGTFTFEDKFARIQDAQQSLVRLQAWLYHFVDKNADFHDEAMDSLPLSIVQEKAVIMEAYDSWITAAKHLEAEVPNDTEYLEGIKTLLVQYHICRMIMESKFPNDPQVFGASPNPSAHKVLDLAQALLHPKVLSEESFKVRERSRPKYSLETGVVAPLFALALKCSDESVAIRATQMLGSLQRREGLYDSQTMARIIAALKDTRDQEMCIKQQFNGESKEVTALEYHLPSSYLGGGIDKLLSSMDLVRLVN